MGSPAEHYGDGEVVHYPRIPCLYDIPGGIHLDEQCYVRGGTPSNAQRFAINYQCGPSTDPRDDLALHLNFLFTQEIVVRNTLQGGVWGNEETYGGMPLYIGGPFLVEITCRQGHFEITCDDHHFCDFAYRMPLEDIGYVSIDGDVSVDEFGFSYVPNT